ncbi:MAG TPA: TrkA family potassium uptake protein [Acidobacteriota bacterium]
MQRIAVLGLGHFGFHVATTLHELGHEVIALDSNREAVQNIMHRVTKAVVADATERKVLEELGLHEVNVAVVSFGTNFEASVLATLYLHELKVPRLVVKAVSEDQGRILLAIGASEVIHPERDSAIKTAHRIASPNLVDYLPLAKDYGIIELNTPHKFVGKTLVELQLRNRYEVQVLAIRSRSGGGAERFAPKANHELTDDDILVIMGPIRELEALQKLD